MRLGERMVRIEDGQKGVVAQNGPELRIVYEQFGEERIAGKRERWVLDEIEPGPMRGEEKARIAWYADNALRAIERHEPLQHWKVPDLTTEPYDPGLVRVIVDYLSSRTTRSAE